MLLLPFCSAVGAQDSGEGTAMPGEDDEPQDGRTRAPEEFPQAPS